ncbi:MAG: glycosyltransferase family 39 protein [Acidobacteriota bacterium]|nr:glycosyltransferase family 39 protein [Acidobacteriota bacterium]
MLQLHAITTKSFWLDEGSSITMARLDWFNFLRILWRREMNMVLYYLLLRGWLHFGDSVAWIRGLSVVFAVAAIPAIFLLGRKMLGTRFGLVSALLLSVNAFQVRYAQEARTYSLLVLLLIVANYFFVSAIESGRRRDWDWYIAASSLAIYAHFFAVLVVVAHWVALRVMVQTGVTDSSQEVRAQFRRAARLVALWTAPIWIFIATTGAGPIAWIPRPGLQDIIGLLQKLSGNVQPSELIMYAACVLAGLIAGVKAMKRGQPESSLYVILACWFFVPLTIVLLVSIARPVFAPRYLMISLPAWIMLAAGGLSAAAGLPSRSARLMAGVLTVLVALYGLSGVRSYYKADFDIGRNDVRSATAYILDHARSHDGVVFYSLSTRFPYDYYAAHSGKAVKPDTLWPGNNSGVGWRDFMGVPAAARVPEFSQGRDRIWVVTTPLPPNDPRFMAFEAALNQRYCLRDTQDFPYVQVMLFSK